MSYIVAVKRIIHLPEVLDLVQADPSLHIDRQDSETLDLQWSQGDEVGYFQFVQGELQATTPSSGAAEKLASIAETLNATVVGEEELIPHYTGPTTPGVFAGRSTWIGWPVGVLVLAVLLAWRW